MWPHLKTQSPPSWISTSFCNGSPQRLQSIISFIVIAIKISFNMLLPFCMGELFSYSFFKPQFGEVPATVRGNAVFLRFPSDEFNKSFCICKSLNIKLNKFVDFCNFYKFQELLVEWRN